MPKILTCSYCGTRAALVMDKGRHELVCSSCGAPLHEIKQMPGKPAFAPKAAYADAKPSKPAKNRKKKKKKSRFFKEVFDVIEDIFD